MAVVGLELQAARTPHDRPFCFWMEGGGDDQETTRSLPSILNAPIVADVYTLRTFRDCVQLAASDLVSTKKVHPSLPL